MSRIMKSVIIIAICFLFLMACVQIEQPVNETTYKPEFVMTNKTTEKVSMNVTKEQNVSVHVKNETNISVIPPNESVQTNITMEEDLTIAEQYKMIPVLESAVQNSSCYARTWDGIEEQEKRWPLQVKREMRFEYLGGKQFKGWVFSTLSLSRIKLDSETTPVIVDNLVVSCSNATNFSIDWDMALLRTQK